MLNNLCSNLLRNLFSDYRRQTQKPTEEKQHVTILMIIMSIISLTVYIDGIDQLSRLFSKLEGVEGVSHVARARS